MTLYQIENTDVIHKSLKRAGAETEVGRGWFLQVKKKFIDALLEEDE